MTRISILALASLAAVTPIHADAQSAPVAPAPVQSAPSTLQPLPSTATVAQTLGVTLRLLPAILDARERRHDWHTAVEQAGNRIQDPALKSQFHQRIAGIVPAVAKLLMAHPQEYALATVAVYRGKDAPDKQAMVAVTLDGLDSQLGSDFFADVVAGLPQVPSGDGIPAGLSLDTEATSYLVFFLGEKQLEAGDIPHSTFGKSIMLATNRVQKDEQARAASAVAADQARERAAQANAQAQVQAQAQANQSANVPNAGAVNNGYTDGQTAPANPYGYGYNYPLINDGYYYPGVGVPLVIVPGEVQTTPENQRRQGEREHRLERDYQKRATARAASVAGQSAAGVGGSTNGVAVGSSPATGVGPRGATAVGSSPATGTPAPAAAQAGANPGGNQQGTHTPANFPAPGQPGGAPAGSTASNERAPGTTSGPNGSSPSATPHPAAGAPGGAPAAKK